MDDRPNGVSLQDETQIQELLVYAEQRHTESLEQIQTYAPHSGNYDYVLANATLMVQYGSASHCIRIRLIESMSPNKRLPSELLPTHSRWISLIRAVHLAFSGLQSEQKSTDLPFQMAMGASSEEGPHLSNAVFVDDSNTISPQPGPSKGTKELLQPIIVATADSALHKLETRARNLWEAEKSETALAVGSNNTVNYQQPEQDLRGCIEAIKILRGVYDEVVYRKGNDASLQGSAVISPSSSSSSSWNNRAFRGEYPSHGWLPEVQPWLRNYLARVTSLTKSRPPRRTIMAFLSRVPPEYLDLVQPTLDSLPIRNSGNAATTPKGLLLPETSVAQRLSMDIFAHWLVLVMLLDGVWWIGGIGAWELGRVIAARGVEEEDWWPESIYRVGKELRNIQNDN
jgi:hypothetical protein